MKVKLVNKDIRENYTVELLKERGLKGENLNYFLNVPDARALQDPKNLDYIDKAYKVFDDMTQCGEHERIIVVIDSDVDGFTSAAIFIQYLQKFNKSITIEPILHEGKGHGLSDTINTIIDKYNEDPNIRYVVLPDAGSNDYKYIELLKEYKIFCLVLDHHIVEEDTNFSDNAVIINNQLSPNYLNKDLSGAGVTWQFCRYCDEQYGTSYAEDLIDLAALGIVSDMMSVLKLENRYIIHKGFSKINNYFFKVLCEKQSYSMKDKINPTTVAFYITPLINAMIRVGTQEEKERLYLAFVDGHKLVPSLKRGAKGIYEEVAIESARECGNAKSLQKRTLEKVMENLEIKIAKYDLLDNKILFIRLDDDDIFPSELNGLAAMKFVEKYKKPTMVGRLNEEGFQRGSIRGVDNSELTSFKNFLQASNLFEYVQGHDQAAGYSLPGSKLSALHSYANKELENINFNENTYEVHFKRLAIDKDIEDLIYNIGENEMLWGQHNPNPIIYIQDINITKNDIQIMGQNQNTLKIQKNGITYIKFFAKDMIKELKEYDSMKLNIIGEPKINEYYGTVTSQIFIKDYEVKDNRLEF